MVGQTEAFYRLGDSLQFRDQEPADSE
jgi:hypothetical protein